MSRNLFLLTRFYPKNLWILFGLVLYSNDTMWIRDVHSSQDNPEKPFGQRPIVTYLFGAAAVSVFPNGQSEDGNLKRGHYVTRDREFATCHSLRVLEWAYLLLLA